MKNNKLSRRTVLKTGAGGAIGGMLASGTLGDANAAGAPASIYETLGVKPIINAAGTITTLGGSLMPAEVIAAWNAAAKQFVPLMELQNKVGEQIAKLLGVEAALVTTGAAGGIMIGTAACVTYRDRNLVSKLPLPPDAGIEVIRQKAHHDCYDNQVTACGAKLVDVETLDDLEQAIARKKPAMLMAYNFLEEQGKIRHAEWIATARKHGIPTLLDAAADTPPVSRLWEYNELGYDLVVFSGGKAMRGPQNAGLLLGRKDLIEAAKQNTAPRCSNIGRGLKVSKEEMVAMWAAVKRFVELDHATEEREWNRRIDVIVQAVKHIPTLTTKTIVPAIENHVPHLLLVWDEQRVKVTPRQMKARLQAGDPPIETTRVHGTGTEGFLLSVFMLEPGEEQVVAKRVREILEQA